MATTPATAADRASSWTTLLLAAFGAVHVFLAFEPYAFDDAYITYRYAQNLAAGHGFVFNPGERVLGTSTPLYALVLSIPGMLGIDVAVAGRALFSLSLGAVALLGAGFLRGRGHPALAVVFAVWAAWGACDLLYFFGMETPFYIALLLAAWRAALARREVTAGVVAGLAFLTRHDAVLFAGCLLALLWISDRRLPWRGAVACAAVVAPWLLFATLFFGSPVPNTLTAKAGEVAALEYLRDAVGRQMRGFYAPLYNFVPQHRVPAIAIHGMTLALLAPTAVFWRRLPRRDLVVTLALAFPPLLALSYSWIGASPNFGWYLVPGTYLLALFALWSWGRLWERRPLVELAPAAVALALAVATVAFMPAKLREHSRSLTDSNYYRGRNGVYLTLARWIRDRGLGDVRVLLDEPGYFAYQSGNPMIDGAGLITKGIYFTGPAARRTPGMDVIREHRPGLIVTSAVPWPALPIERYLSLYHAVPLRTLHVERPVYMKRFAKLADRWLARDGYYPDPVVPLRHPLVWDFEGGDRGGWITGGEIQGFTGRPLAFDPASPEADQDYLHTVGSRGLWGTVSSPPFLIDFEELSFRFAGTHPRFTLARLLVDGQQVLSVDGGGGTPLELRDVSWPVASWTGKIGVLQFYDADTEDGFLLADRVRSVRHLRRVVLDDFEEASFGGWWESAVGVAPARLAPLARKRGLAMMVGRRAASSGLEGRAELRSRPFRIDRDHLSFLVFDFGGDSTRVELRVDGDVRRRFVGARSERLDGVVWSVDELLGREAVLAMIDEAPAAREWIGIDDVAVFDAPAGGGLSLE